MQFLDAIDRCGKSIAVQIFATDVDQEGLAVARAGVYAASIAEHVSSERLNKYFQPIDGGTYQVRSSLRDSISFAAHDLTRDPPFSRMDLVTCRNVLIYLRPETQRYVLKSLHFALCQNGYLFLGSSESTGQHRGLFTSVSKTWRIYRKLGSSRPVSTLNSRHRSKREKEEKPVSRDTTNRPGPTGGEHDIARRSVLQARVDPTLIVAENGDILFLHGDLRPYLTFPQGDDPRLDLNSIITPDLATRTRGALYKCRRDRNTVIAQASQVHEGRHVQVTATPADDVAEGAVILTFEDIDTRAAEPTGSQTQADAAMIDTLERELSATREDLRNTVEELESSNEELRSSNEESMSMNEELQSANEELEATAEELRSLNEELTTVNNQLREKIDLLEQSHDDLTNFFASTKVATVFLDDQLSIKRFTPAAAEMLGLREGDTGRFIGDIARDLLHNGLETDARTVLDQLGVHRANCAWVIVGSHARFFPIARRPAALKASSSRSWM
jgi:two-component system CheB/CheR fusion protein